MAEVKNARMEPPKYEVIPFLGPDFFRTNLFGTNPFTLMRRFSEEVVELSAKLRKPPRGAPQSK